MQFEIKLILEKKKKKKKTRAIQDTTHRVVSSFSVASNCEYSKYIKDLHGERRGYVKVPSSKDKKKKKKKNDEMTVTLSVQPRHMKKKIYFLRVRYANRNSSNGEISLDRGCALAVTEVAFSFRLSARSSLQILRL